MSLLSIKDREKRLKYLGYGEYNKANVRKFQKAAFPRSSKRWTGEYDTHTDRALRTFYNVKRYGGGYFEPEEFRCNCSHCCGYPSYMKKVEIEHLARIRKHYGKPMKITSGLRCKDENRRVGGVPNSGHTRGYAADFYMKGVTDTVDHREKVLKWMKKQPNHEFTYGANMKDSNGQYRTASGMGNAMHTETHKPKSKMQPWYDAMKDQYNWSKNQRYNFNDYPTVENSEEEGTCITFPSVSLQRLGLLPKGSYFYYHPDKNRISGNCVPYVRDHPEIFAVSYPHKTIHELVKEGKLDPGAIIGFDDPSYHTMVFMGFNKKGQPIFNTMGHKRGLKVTYPAYADRKVDMVVTLKKVS